MYEVFHPTLYFRLYFCRLAMLCLPLAERGKATISRETGENVAYAERQLATTRTSVVFLWKAQYIGDTRGKIAILPGMSDYVMVP